MGRCRAGWHGVLPLQERLHLGDQLARLNGLGQICVSAGLETIQFVIDLSARGKHHD